MANREARSLLPLVVFCASRLGDKLKLCAFGLRGREQVTLLVLISEGRVLEREYLQVAVVEEVVGLSRAGALQGVYALPPAVPLPEGFGEPLVGLQAERGVPADRLVQRVGDDLPSLL